MFKLRPDQIVELRYFATISDKEIRSDLCRNYIKNENDYTSNFTGAFRRNINSYTKTGLKATSLLLNSAHERQFGCDATIIVCSNGKSKIAIFEAKWPRLRTKSYRWDYSQTATGLSHFSDQLDRQAWQNGDHAVFEMFFCEYMPFSQPKYMKDEVSSCVWHDDAMSFKNNRKSPNAIWDHADLISLLKSGNIEIGEIVEAVCLCQAGTPISMTDPLGIAMEFRLPPNILFIEAGE